MFIGPGVCIRSYAAAVTGGPAGTVDVDPLPEEWFAHVEHAHRAIDDTVGHANLLVELFRWARTSQHRWRRTIRRSRPTSSGLVAPSKRRPCRS